VEERAADILALWEARKDISLEELRIALAEVGPAVSPGFTASLRAGAWRVKNVWPAPSASRILGCSDQSASTYAVS